MTYTLMKGLLWYLLALGLGLIIGWLLRSVVAGRQLRRARTGQDAAEVERLRERVAELEQAVVAQSRSTLGAHLDAGEAARILGRPVTPDDLTLIDGIDLDVAEMCHGIGIRTWADLADAEASLLHTMLADAGRIDADPSAWPARARLLAEGRWGEFAAVGQGERPSGAVD